MATLPATLPFQLGATFPAESGMSAELTVPQRIKVHGGGRTQVNGYVPRRGLPLPSWSDFGIAGAAASIVGPAGALIAGVRAGNVCALIGAGVFGVWHYARRDR
jgi:hypothetical protein